MVTIKKIEDDVYGVYIEGYFIKTIPAVVYKYLVSVNFDMVALMSSVLEKENHVQED